MSLKDYQWKSVYRSGDQNLLKDFYKPVLSNAIRYDRAVGYFSAETLAMNLQGISSLIANDGKMRLIIGHPLSEEEFKAVKLGHELNMLLEDLETRLLEVIEKSKGHAANRLEILAWLIASNRLDIKFALRRKGMYHEKIGIVQDRGGDIVVFQGSANETVYALDEGFNAESIMVFTSWNDAVFSEYGLPCINGFEDLWNDKQRNTITIDVPSKFYEKIVENLLPDDAPSADFEDRFEDAYKEFFEDELTQSYPKVPESIDGKEFKIFEHQKQAIRMWVANQYKGIFKLATGAGKTITAIYAATRVFEARRKKNLGLVLIIAVPYQELAKQWVSNLKIFNISPIKCWQSKSKWHDDLKSDILAFQMGAIDFIGIVVVNRTLESDAFQGLINGINGNQVMLIGDECHNHGASKINSLLPDVYYRIGLSATPFRSDEDEFDSPFPNEARERLLEYYGPVVAEYTLGDAINDGILCEYDYHVVPIYLSEGEQEKFDELSIQIGQLIGSSKTAGLSTEQKNRLTALCGKRSRLLGSAENKLDALVEIVAKIDSPNRKHTLFYCGEGFPDREIQDVGDAGERVIQMVSKVLSEQGWRTSRFTSEEDAEQRSVIMRNFIEGHIDALVSIRVLDEGVDVPVCDKAFILASTRNPRQYVQRRGRVLRKAKGKDKAIIFDFVVLPCAGAEGTASKQLKEAELERVDDFCKLALNRFEVEESINRLRLRDD